jgi:hypothetical protein
VSRVLKRIARLDEDAASSHKQAAIRTVIATVLAEQGEDSGRGLDAFFAMRQAEAIVKALEHAGYEITHRR